MERSNSSKCKLAGYVSNHFLNLVHYFARTKQIDNKQSNRTSYFNFILSAPVTIYYIASGLL